MSVSARALWHSAPPPHCSLSLVVGVPVRNEAEGLAATLRSLAAQTELDGSRFDPSRFEVLLLVNNCTDESARIARHFATSHPDLALHIEDIHLSPADAHIGHVRRLLMDAACIRLAAIGAARGIAANTDGDTQVDSFWLARTRQEFELGADAVGGRITLDPGAPIHPTAKKSITPVSRCASKRSVSAYRTFVRGRSIDSRCARLRDVLGGKLPRRSSTGRQRCPVHGRRFGPTQARH